MAIFRELGLSRSAPHVEFSFYGPEQLGECSKVVCLHGK